MRKVWASNAWVDADRDTDSDRTHQGTVTYSDVLAKAIAIQAGDIAAATALVDSIVQLLQTSDLVTNQRRYLYRLRRKWARRAAGTDHRWLVWGAESGNKTRRRTRRQQVSVSPPQYNDDDPLVQSILHKFGTPIRVDY